MLGRAALDPAAAGGLGLVVDVATLDDLAGLGQPPYVLEALIDSVRCVAEADVALRGQAGRRRRSGRCRCAARVPSTSAAFAVGLGGGGHRFAAGFSAGGTVESVMASIRAALADRVVLVDQG